MNTRANFKSLSLGLGAALLLISSAHARDERLHFPIKEALATPDAKAMLGDDVKFFFGNQKAPKSARTYGSFTANKKTNFANKSDKDGCERAFLSALLSLQDRARREGGNAVVNIQSYYKKAPFVSDTEYECAAGKIMGGVALRGTVAKL